MGINDKNIKVCHMTSAHRNDDARIFHKQCTSLARAGYDTYLIAQGETFEKNGVHIVGTPKIENGRLARMTQGAKFVYKKALEIDADIYQIHDPELLPYALKLKKKGKKVIFDSHEDYASTIGVKNYIPKMIRKTVEKMYVLYEGYVCSKVSGIITCYHWTEERLKTKCKNTEFIVNYPIIENRLLEMRYDETSNSISYAGGISAQWNHKNIILALARTEDKRYRLAGNGSGEYFKELTKLKAWENVDYLGLIPHESVNKEVYLKSFAGMCLLDYIPQCKGKFGNLSNTKFYEYMLIGLPIICTDFELWKKIINEYKCGIYVCPDNVDQIVEAINYLANNPAEAKRMGENGRRAIVEKFNWTIEESKLLKLYRNVLEE